MFNYIIVICRWGLISTEPALFVYTWCSLYGKLPGRILYFRSPSYSNSSHYRRTTYAKTNSATKDMAGHH